MNVRLIAMVLMLATVFGLFGCTASMTTDTENAAAVEAPNFIGGKSDALGETETVARPENLLNLAQVDKNGNATFQIVYPAGASEQLIAECEAFSEDIFATTGVKIPVVHSVEASAKNEILVGDILRPEVVDVIDQFDLNAEEILIKAVGTRVLIYSKSAMALVSALTYFKESVVYRSTNAKEYGIARDFEIVCSDEKTGSVQMLSADDRYVEFALPGTMHLTTYVRMSFTGNSGWRLQTKTNLNAEYNDMGAAQRLAYSLGEADPSRIEKIEAVVTDTKCTVTAADGSYVEINLSQFRMTFYTPSGPVAAEVTDISSNALGSSITGVLEKDEAIFGTGERFNTANQRGNYIEMFTKDIWSKSDACYMVIPLLCSSRGSGIFVNLYEHMTMDLGKGNETEWKTVVTSAPLDAYIYTTEKIADVIKAYSDLTGYAEMPEEWTYGMLVCAKSPDLSEKWTASITPSTDGRGEGIYEMIANMEKYDLPWTGVLSEPWGPYRSGKHEDLKELCDYVHSLGKKFIVYMRVGDTGTDMKVGLPEYVKKIPGFKDSYFLTQTQANGTVSPDLPDTTVGTNNPDVGAGVKTHQYLDITNPDAVFWFFNEYWDYLLNAVGVDGCKIDFCETLPENYPLNYYDKTMPTSGSHHWYPTAFCAMYWDLASSKPDSGMNYTRGGGIGSQRAPYMWAGDQARGYQSLAFQLTAVLSSGLSGVPYMSYDMAGYQYGRFSKDIAYESQVFIRGTQFTAFTICMQTHGTVRRSYQFAEEDPNYAYVTEIYRAYTKLHEHLTPYITELSEEACNTGMPVMRHLILGWQGDKTAWDIEDQYMFGDAFMIAPILDEKNTRKIYLPEGEWVDLNTGKEYSVGKDGLWLTDAEGNISYSASIAELPTFYNKNTVSEIAPTLVDGIMALYDYARSVVP